MSRINRVLLVILTLVIGLGLGACGSGDSKATVYLPESAQTTQAPTQEDKVAETVFMVEKTTPDHRTVTCAVYLYKNVECDWAHAK